MESDKHGEGRERYPLLESADITAFWRRIYKIKKERRLRLGQIAEMSGIPLNTLTSQLAMATKAEPKPYALAANTIIALALGLDETPESLIYPSEDGAGPLLEPGALEAGRLEELRGLGLGVLLNALDGRLSRAQKESVAAHALAFMGLSTNDIDRAAAEPAAAGGGRTIAERYRSLSPEGKAAVVEETLDRAWEKVESLMESHELSFRSATKRTGVDTSVLWLGVNSTAKKRAEAAAKGMPPKGGRPLARTRNSKLEVFLKIANSFDVPLDELLYGPCVDEMRRARANDLELLKARTLERVKTALAEADSFKSALFTMLPYLSRPMIDALKAHLLSFFEPLA